MDEMTVIVKRFDELTTRELYEILALRSKVFVVEQDCAYQDPDGLDYESIHLFAMRLDGSVSAYARLHWKNGDSGTMRLGRVVSGERGVGLGMKLLSAAIEQARAMGAREIYIEAQRYAIGFYEKAGFTVTSKPFLEDGIPHVTMRLPL